MRVDNTSCQCQRLSLGGLGVLSGQPVSEGRRQEIVGGLVVGSDDQAG